MAELNTNINVNTNVEEAVNQFKALKKELKDNIGELAGLKEGTAEFNAQATKVGQLKDRIADLNQTVASVSGSPIENLTGSFGLLSGQVKNLDFDGATTSLSSFAGQIKSFSFKDLIAGAKSFTSTLGQLGKALLTNPIFLIIGLVTAIGAAVFALKDKIKFLGDAFEAVGNIIDGVVQAGKDFLDFIGLTNFAIEDKAAKTIEAAKAEAAAVTERYDREIKIAQSAGKDTAKIEEEKRQAVLRTIKAQVDALKTLREINGEYTEDQIKQLKDLSKQFNDIQTETTINENKRIEERKKSNKAANDARLAANKQLTRQIEDEQIAAIEDEEVRATAVAVKAKERRDEDIKNSKASADIKREALVASELQLETDMENVNKTFDEKRKARLETYLKAQEEFNAKSLAKSQELASKDLEIELSKAKSVDERFKIQNQIIELNHQKQVSDINKAANEEIAAQKKLLDDKIINEQEYAERVKKINDDKNHSIAQADTDAAAATAATKKAATDAKFAEFQEDLGQVQSYVGAVASAITQTLAIVQEVRNQKRKEELDSINVQATEEQAAIQAQLDAGLISKKQADQLKYESEVTRINAENKAKEKAFEQDKKMRIAQTVIATITGALSAFSGAMQLGPIAGPIVGGILGTIVTVMGAVAVSNISKQKFQATALPAAPAGGVGAAAEAIQSEGIQSSKFKAETIGQAGTVNGGDNDPNKRQAQRVYVLESDITNTQNKVKTIESQATIK